MIPRKCCNKSDKQKILNSLYASFFITNIKISWKVKLTFVVSGQENEVILILGGRAGWAVELVAATGLSEVRQDDRRDLGTLDETFIRSVATLDTLLMLCNTFTFISDHWKNIKACLSWVLIDTSNINLRRAKAKLYNKSQKPEKVYFSLKGWKDFLWSSSLSSVLVLVILK